MTTAIKQMRDPEQELREIIGANITRALAERDQERHEETSCAEFAREIGANPPQMSAWMRGRTKPSKRYLDQLAAALAKSYCWFMDRHDAA